MHERERDGMSDAVGDHPLRLLPAEGFRHAAADPLLPADVILLCLGRAELRVQVVLQALAAEASPPRRSTVATAAPMWRAQGGGPGCSRGPSSGPGGRGHQLEAVASRVSTIATPPAPSAPPRGQPLACPSPVSPVRRDAARPVLDHDKAQVLDRHAVDLRRAVGLQRFGRRKLIAAHGARTHRAGRSGRPSSRRMSTFHGR